jgi:protein SCO1/2
MLFRVRKSSHSIYFFAGKKLSIRLENTTWKSKLQSLLPWLFFLGCFSLVLPAHAVEKLNDPQKAVVVDEKLSNQISPDLMVTDHLGRSIPLKNYFQSEKPVLLTLNYYSCATLCSVQLNAVLEGLKALDWTAGEEFTILTLSIDPDETAELAMAKRKSYLSALGKGEVDWNFAVASKEVIAEVADTVGYGYSYDPKTKQYAHPAVIMFLSPEGAVSRYLYGIQYPARDMKFALIEASEGRVGSPVEKLILSCFSYDNSVGKYTPAAFGIMRLGGISTLIALSIFVLVLRRQEKDLASSRSTQ